MIDHFESIWANDFKAALYKYQVEFDKDGADTIALRDAFQHILWNVLEYELEYTDESKPV